MTRSRFPRLRLNAVLLAIALTLATASQLGAALSISRIAPNNPSFSNQFAPGVTVQFMLSSSPADGSYQWFHDNAPISGATSATYTIASVAASDSGNYTLRRTSGSVVETSNTSTINVLPFPPSPIDPTFTAALPGGSSNSVVATFADGSMYVFSVSSVTTNGTYLRLNADGSADSTFTFPTAAGSVLLALPDRSLITSQAPYRLNADGTSHALTLPSGFDSTARLTAAARQADGKLLIAQGTHVARLNADDSVDNSFSYASGLSSGHNVNGFKFDPSGRIYLYATERDSNPSNFPSSWSEIVRLTSAGARDTTFASQEPPLRRGGLEIYPLSDGRLLRFSSYETIPYWAMLNDDGTTSLTWSAAYSGPLGATITVDPVSFRIFVTTYGIIERARITATSLVKDTDFYQGNGYAGYTTLDQSGRLLVSTTSSSWDGHASNGLVRLDSTASVSSFPPIVNVGISGNAPVNGGSATLTAKALNGGPFTYQWLALDGQPLPTDQTSVQLTITNFSMANLGRYQVRVTSPYGSILSDVTTLSIETGFFEDPYLANLSGRAFVGTGDDTAIAGFAVKIDAGALGLPLLVRGAGPALRSYGVEGALPNPVINFYTGAQSLLANNDNWGGTADLTKAASSSGAFPFAADSNDSALQRSPGTGNYSVQLKDQSNASGVGLLELYRMNYSPGFDSYGPSLVPGRLTNLSFRARTAPGEKVATAGFVITDPLNYGRGLRLLIRVVGPTLANYGVSAPLPDPVLTLYDSKGAVVATNDNWAGATVAATTQVGAFDLPTGSKDAALVLDLPAGVYSVQAAAAPNTTDTGVVLIEIYLVK